MRFFKTELKGLVCSFVLHFLLHLEKKAYPHPPHPPQPPQPPHPPHAPQAPIKSKFIKMRRFRNNFFIEFSFFAVVFSVKTRQTHKSNIY